MWRSSRSWGVLLLVAAAVLAAAYGPSQSTALAHMPAKKTCKYVTKKVHGKKKKVKVCKTVRKPTATPTPSPTPSNTPTPTNTVVPGLGLNWREMGPAGIPAPEHDATDPSSAHLNGAIEAIAPVPSTCSAAGCSTIYIGALDGGVWKTTDGGSGWRSLTDGMPNPAIRTLALDPVNTNILYAGTDSSSRGLESVMRTTDGGASWTELPPPAPGESVQDLLIDPRTAGTTHETLYAATTGGVYISHDGGETWEQSMARPQSEWPDGLVMARSNPDILYDAVSNQGVFETTDGGKTWQELTGGLPVFAAFDISLAIAPSDPNVVYAYYRYAPPDEALYATTDGGATWQKRTGLEYVFNMEVDPSNAGLLWADGTEAGCYNGPLVAGCGQIIERSADGGTTWQSMSPSTGETLHQDSRTLAIIPGSANVMYLTGDGGLYRSLDGGVTWRDLNRGLNTNLVDTVSAGPAGSIYAGVWDNGCFRLDELSLTTTSSGDRDCTSVAADRTDPLTAYDSAFGNVEKTTDGFRTGSVVVRAEEDTLYSPVVAAPAAPNTVFMDANRVWRSETKGGSDWVPISFDLNCDAPPSDPAATCPTTVNHWSMDSSTADANTLVLAQNGHVWLTTNALAPVQTDRPCILGPNVSGSPQCDMVSGPTWKRIDSGLPAALYDTVAFAPGSTSTIYVGEGDLRPGNQDAAYLFRSTDGGASWTPIEGVDGSLPRQGVTALAVNPANGHLYVALGEYNASRYGIYTSSDGGAHWTEMDRGLPYAAVDAMTVSPQSGDVVIATWGRGLWEAPAP